jgi:pantoate kinase
LFPCNVRELAAFAQIATAMGLSGNDEGQRLLHKLLNAAKPLVLMDASREFTQRLNNVARKIGCAVLIPES